MHSFATWSRSIVTAICVAAPWLAPAPLRAQAAPQVVGPAFCIECHDHAREREWYEQKDGPAPPGHRKAIQQLSDKRSARWARAIGLSSPDDPRGACVACHATVVRGESVAGVSCEHCHGPARAYLVPHQDKGAYATAVSLGLYDTRGKPAAWVASCVQCHVIASRSLLAAGHPSGAAFTVAGKLKSVVHWAKVYPDSVIADAETAARASLRASMAKAAESRDGRAVRSPVEIAPPPPAAARDPLTTVHDRTLRLLADLVRRGGVLPPGVQWPPTTSDLLAFDPAAAIERDIVSLAVRSLTEPRPAPPASPARSGADAR